jgi:hypothetical protein
MAAFRCGALGVGCAALALASVRSRPDTGSSRDVVLSDFRTEASGSAGDLLEALVERERKDRAVPEAKLPLTF